MRRFLFITIFLGLAAALGVFLWLRAGAGGVVKLTDEEKAAAVVSGEGSREIEIEDGAGFPAIEELEHVASRERVAAWAKEAAAARAAAGESAGGDLLVLSAELERLLGNLKSATEFATAGVRALPSNSQARLVLANCILSKIKANAAGQSAPVAIVKNLGLAGELKAELEVALELDPNNHGARVRLAGMKAFVPFPLKSMGGARELVAGIGAYDSYLQKFWDGQLMVAEGNTPEAIAHFRTLLEERPDDADVFATLGELFLKEESWPEAAAEYDRIVAMELDGPRMYDALYGAAKAREGGGFDLEGALAMLSRLIADDPVGDLIPSEDRVKFHEGNLLAALGRADEARAAYSRALEVAPGAKRVEEALAQLQ